MQPGVGFTHYRSRKGKQRLRARTESGDVRPTEDGRRQTEVKIEFLDLPGERIPLADAGRVDTVARLSRYARFPAWSRQFKVYSGSWNQGANSYSSDHSMAPDPAVQRQRRQSIHAPVLGARRLPRDPVRFRPTSARAASIKNRSTQGTFLLFQSQGRTAGGMEPNQKWASQGSHCCGEENFR